MARYLITLKNGRQIEVTADAVTMTNPSTGRTVDLDAAAYDEIDLEAAALGLGEP